MNRFIRPIVLGAMMLVLATSALAENAAKVKKARKPKPVPLPAAFKVPDRVSLSTEQQAKLDEIKGQFVTKLTDARKKIEDVYTDEQRAARKTAKREAVAAGKKGKELQEAAAAAVTLSDEQRQKLTEAQTEFKELAKGVRKQVVALLTAEQKRQLKQKKA